ncbi:hypothetical protein [Nocardioides aurantiacus]|uniref:DUF2613 family protein n=1 Tax=Nocardioides aurantiacus TaxID=86796 RepID=A0A3N2CVA8_9ACTN|nr:hypothetical protein [Nocardioides aurantiacus]ROR91419.1 hypothetical protein EDD33_2285 [Nocardioides aurantiacus]
MQGLVAGGIAVLVGAGLAVTTAFGVVSSVNGEASQPEQSVMDYGTNQ